MTFPFPFTIVVPPTSLKSFTALRTTTKATTLTPEGSCRKTTTSFQPTGTTASLVMNEPLNATLTATLKLLPTIRAVPLLSLVVSSPTSCCSEILKIPTLATTNITMSSFPCVVPVPCTVSATIALGMTRIITKLRNIPATIPSTLSKPYTIK